MQCEENEMCNFRSITKIIIFLKMFKKIRKIKGFVSFPLLYCLTKLLKETSLKGSFRFSDTINQLKDLLHRQDKVH